MGKVRIDGCVQGWMFCLRVEFKNEAKLSPVLGNMIEMDYKEVLHVVKSEIASLHPQIKYDENEAVKVFNDIWDMKPDKKGF